MSNILELSTQVEYVQSTVKDAIPPPAKTQTHQYISPNQNQPPLPLLILSFLAIQCITPQPILLFSLSPH